MTKAEHIRLVTWRSKILQHATGEHKNVSQTCRFFGISRKTYYKWANRWRTYGDAGLGDRARVARRFPRATPAAVVINQKHRAHDRRWSGMRSPSLVIVCRWT
jgi:transposase-like protein